MGLLDNTGFDPQTQGLLAAAFQGLQASGPSRMPVSLGQIIGQGGMAGLNEYQQAMQLAQKKKRDDALMALEQQKAAFDRQKMAQALKQQIAVDAFQGRVARGEFTQSSAQQALTNGQGPTPENAGLIPNLTPKFDKAGMLKAAIATPGLFKEGLSGLMTMDENAAKRDETRSMFNIKIAEARAAGQEKLAADLQKTKDIIESRNYIAEQLNATRRDTAAMVAGANKEKAPSGYRLNMDGTLSFIKGGPADPEVIKGKAQEKPITEVQGKSNLYQSRAVDANKVISELEGKYSPAEIATKQGLGKVWGMGGALEAGANVILPKKAQQVEQAQRNFVNAVLRQESGAAIADSEFANAQKQYFPQPGDAAPVLAQKKANRERAIEGLQVMAGPAMKRRASDAPGAVVDFSELPK